MSNVSKGLKEQSGIRGKRFGISGFSREDSLWIAEELAESGGFSRILSDSPLPLSPELNAIEALILDSSVASVLCATNGIARLSEFKCPLSVVGDSGLRGTSFVQVLPCLGPPVSVSMFGKWLAALDQKSLIQTDAARLPLARIRILIADDHSATRNMVGRILNRPSMECHEALDGRQAVSLVKLLMPDLVVLDLNMPGLDGFRVLSEIRNDAGTRSAKVILLTGRHSVSDIELADQLGADMYVVKPLQINDFRSRVEGLLWKDLDYALSA
jgi:CheY-like chemotaxis protein